MKIGVFSLLIFIVFYLSAQPQTININHLAGETITLQHDQNEIGMSNSQLYRKLKAITGKSTAIYIRYNRLIMAKNLLETTDKTVSEVAYTVGFKELAYFSRCFSEEFGYPPSQVR